MSNKVLVGIVVGLVVVVAGWMILYVPQASTTDTSYHADNSSQANVAATITYTNEGFSPSQLNVKSGDTVRVINLSTSSLEFASGNHPDHSVDPELNMAPIKAGDEGFLKVTRVGSWTYHDHLKHDHTGILTVTQ